MVIILSVIGLVAAAWVWQNVNPIAGLLVGFLFVGGLGWRALGFVIGSLRPSARQAYGDEGKELIAAWESRFGELRPGSANHPPAGTFQRWLRAKRSTHVSAAEWIDAQLAPESHWIERPSHTTQELDQEEESPDTSAIIGWCEVMTEGPERVYPLMMSKADSAGLTLMELPGFSTFASVPWADLYSWERLSEYDTGGNWVWLLTPFDTDRLPHDVIGLAIREPSDRTRWERLLAGEVPGVSDEEE